jgi:NitT/TauT family transport system permease protein
MLERIRPTLPASNVLRLIFLVCLISVFVILAYQIFLRTPYDLLNIILYTGLSVLRIAASYVVSLVTAIALGFLMWQNKTAEKILLPFLDIMQSVPVVGFFPAAIGIFVALFKGERLGIELASVFLIFTSQAWNMIFGVYESLKVLPKDIQRLLNAYNIKGWIAIRKVYLPATIPSLIFNSNVSWGNSWYFLMASEVFAIGAKQFKLPGIGYILWKSSESGDLYGVLAGFLAIIITVVAMSLFIWEPFTSWSSKFSFQMLPQSEQKTENPILSRFKDFWQLISPLSKNFEENLKLRLQKTTWLDKVARTVERLFAGKKWYRLFKFLMISAFFLLLIYLLFVLIKFTYFLFTTPLPRESRMIPLFLLYSMGRLILVQLSCLLTVTLVAFFLYFSSRRVSDFMMTIMRILSSLPGTALKPFLLSLIAGKATSLNIEMVTFVILFSTMIWYNIFPVASRIYTIPKELKEPVHLFARSKKFILKKLVLPASFPGLVTGSFAAVGAGWNALVVAEFSIFRHKVYKVDGIGYLIDYAAIIKGDTVLLTLCLSAMIALIILLNNLIWQRLYNYAEKKYTLELE